ncbi:AfsR/SARP family transcriptional regulator [Fodinicola acaciae]|uniref:AfsR/SARP family transcriptional regulator n=1 Tax=Fodinicola acaciae TaxID=2681555 RepID=UPI0013D0B904|nr:BTAD domain-containing putative transcriptional regulator [Fodinicola acaciae]
MTAELRIRILGPWDIQVDHRQVSIPRGQLRIFLASLLLSAHEPVPVATLVERGWPERAPQRASATLHTYATRLRKLLGHDLIQTARGNGYLLRVPSDVVDLHQFRDLLSAAHSAPSPDEELDCLHHALSLWRGKPFGDEASTWLDREVVPRLIEEWFTATERRIDLELSLGRPAQLVPELWDLTERYPTRESLWVRLITALHQAGRRADALHAYQKVRAILHDELGIDPSDELAQLQRAVLLDTNGGASTAFTASRPRQLPHDIPHVVGRDAEVALLDAAVVDGRTAIVAIDGAPGTGKTTLAVHWAHRVAERYPDVQLHLNLRGYGPGEPVEPKAAIETLLRALGVTHEKIPNEVEERAALLRTTLAGRRALILLDNARNASQVRPLLPSTDSLVVVTSRNQLRGLAVLNGAHRITLDRLADAPALEVLATAIGAERVEAEPAAAAELVALCDRLPLALAIVAERAHRSERLADVVRALTDEAARLDELGTGEDDPQTDLRAALSWSYQALSPAAASMLRHLGRHPAGDIALETAAALAGLPVPRAKDALDRLLAAHLVEQRRPDRYEVHDLIRLYAADQGERHETGAERDAAIGRVLDWYLHAAVSADKCYRPLRRRDFVHPYEPQTPPPRFDGLPEAAAWLETEYDNLRTVITWAATHGWVGHAWRTAVAMASYFESRLPWRDATDALRTAYEGASAAGDVIGQAYTLNSIGCTHLDMHDIVVAKSHFERALARFVAEGDLGGEAMVRGNLALALAEKGDREQALAHCRRALELCEQRGYRRGVGMNLDNLGIAYSLTGDHDRAIECLMRARQMFRELNDRVELAWVAQHMGQAYARVGERRAAVAAFCEAIRGFRQDGNRRFEVLTLVELGRLLEHCGHEKMGRGILDAMATYADLTADRDLLAS